MYCINCGKKIIEGHNYCINCGRKIDVANSNSKVKTGDNGLRIASIVLGIIAIVCSLLVLFFPLGFVLSIIGFILALIALKDGNNTLGIVLNIVGFILPSIIIMIIIGLVIYSTYEYNEIDYDDDFSKYYLFPSSLDIIDSVYNHYNESGVDANAATVSIIYDDDSVIVDFPNSLIPTSSVIINSVYDD